ncbi:isoaspartyl dipeptidase-like protein [Bipolaris maydis]|nr:isoaspartyl dipeptidase-like protein [Bipolaris maydis]
MHSSQPSHVVCRVSLAVNVAPEPYQGPPRNTESIKNLKWEDHLQPKRHEISGTNPESKILFLDVNILDSSGREPFRGDVLIEGERFTAVGQVPDVEQLKAQAGVRVFHGKGRTLMSGLGDAHTHFTWNGGDLEQLGTLGVEEHTLLTMRSAQCFLDSGYTICFGAASAKERLDVVIRDAINAGDISGPRYLANGKEMARRGGELVGGITAFADGPEEMREVIKHHVQLGVDNIKLSMSGEEITETRSAQDCYFTDEETQACVDEAHKHGKRLCSHARARDSVIMSVRHGIEAIYHASYIDDRGMHMLEQAKAKHIVAPAINWLVCTLNDAETFGYPREAAEEAGYKRELDIAIAGLREMHRRGIVVLPGGDYGFAWTPHGTYARDLEHFVKLLGFNKHEAIIAATAGVAALFMQSNELGKVQPGYYADCILVDGDPLEDITVLQNHDKLNVICINGRVHKAGTREYMQPSVSGQDNNSHVVVPDQEFLTVRNKTQVDSKLH